MGKKEKQTKTDKRPEEIIMRFAKRCAKAQRLLAEYVREQSEDGTTLWSDEEYNHWWDDWFIRVGKFLHEEEK